MWHGGKSNNLSWTVKYTMLIEIRKALHTIAKGNSTHAEEIATNLPLYFKNSLDLVEVGKGASRVSI